MPFYREVWFLVMVAITTTIIIILVATILCVKGSAYKYKRESRISVVSVTIIRPLDRSTVLMLPH